MVGQTLEYVAGKLLENLINYLKIDAYLYQMQIKASEKREFAM